MSLLASGLAIFAISASAASLGGINSQDVFTQSGPASVTIPLNTTFTGCSANIDGWVDNQGNQWTTVNSPWQCMANELVRSRHRVSLSHAYVDVGQSSGFSLTTQLQRISSSNNRSGPGIAMYADGAGHLIYAIYERDQDRVTLGINSPYTGQAVLAQVAPISDLSAGPIGVEIDGTSLTVLVNGIAELSYDLSSLPLPDQDYFLDLTNFGLVADNDNWSRFDDFVMGALP